MLLIIRLASKKRNIFNTTLAKLRSYWIEQLPPLVYLYYLIISYTCAILSRSTCQFIAPLLGPGATSQSFLVPGFVRPNIPSMELIAYRFWRRAVGSSWIGWAVQKGTLCIRRNECQAFEATQWLLLALQLCDYQDVSDLTVWQAVQCSSPTWGLKLAFCSQPGRSSNVILGGLR